MRPTRTASCLPPAFPGGIPGVIPGAVLALSVLLCGGSVADVTTAAVLIQHSQERAGQLTRDPESVASLFACFGEAGKDVQKRLGSQHAAIAFRRWRPSAVSVVRLPIPATVRAVPHGIPLTLTLIDLPPPASTL